MSKHSRDGEKMRPKRLFYHMVSYRDLDLWPFYLKIQSVHLCAKVHESCKVGDTPAGSL